MQRSTNAKISFVAAIFIVLSTLPPLFAQGVHPVTGRQIAPVMGVGGADWLDREERVSEEHPEKAMAALDLHAGMMVADVGAGTGFYSLRLARAVAPSGVVFAEDIQPGMIERLKTNAARQHIANIVPIVGTASDPHLPEEKLDLVLLVDVYHEFSQPQRMLQHIRDSLKPNGRLVLLEFRKEDAALPIRPEHKMSVKEVQVEVMPEGYQFEKLVDTMPRQHILFFRRSAGPVQP